MDWAGNNKRQCSFHSYTNTHNNIHVHVLLNNSPSKDQNGLGREEGKAVLISTHTQTHKHNSLLHNSPSNVENGSGRKQGSAHFHSYNNTQTQCTFHNSPTKIENGLSMEQGKAVLICIHTLTHKYNALLHNSPATVEN